MQRHPNSAKLSSAMPRILCGMLTSLAVCAPMLTSLISVTSQPSPATAQTSSGGAAANGRFQIIGNKIYDPNGKEFIVKGTNINGPNFVWPGDTPGYADSVKNCWGFNTIRLDIDALINGTYLHSDQHAGYSENGTIDQIVNAYTSKGVVVLIDGHDHTGDYYQGQDLENLKGYFRDLATKYKNNPYVWFNIQNEPGHNDPSDFGQWVSSHQAVIKTIRDEAGADNIIIADGRTWGQDGTNGGATNQDSAIIKSGAQLIDFNGKTYKNVMFSVHVYNPDATPQRLNDYFGAILGANHAVLVGEYGVDNHQGYMQGAVSAVMGSAPNLKVGRIVWAWWGGDGNKLTTTNNGGGEYVDSCQNPTNLTWFGRQVWNDLRRPETLGSIGSNPGGSNPGTGSPGGTNPGTGSPGGTNPGGSNPGTGSPGGTNPGGSNPGTGSPGSGNPSNPTAGKSGSFPVVSTPRTVSGKKDSFWNAIPAYKIQNTSSSNPGKDGGTVRGAWDNSNLYLLYEVTDKKKVNSGTTDWWTDDGVQIYLDSTNSKTSSYQSNDYSIGLRWHDSMVYGGDKLPGVTFAQTDTANGYIIEVKIPFSSLGIKPQAGYKMGFDTQLNDADSKGSRARLFQLFDGSNKAWQDPSVFGTITLAGSAQTSQKH